MSCDEKDVFWWRWLLVSNVRSHGKTHTQFINEPSAKYHRYSAEHSAMHHKRFGVDSALHQLTVNDVLLEPAMIGDPLAYDRQISAMRQGRNGDVLTTSWRS